MRNIRLGVGDIGGLAIDQRPPAGDANHGRETIIIVDGDDSAACGS